MRLQPLVHVADMKAAVAFFEAIGAEVRHGSRDGDFVLLRIGGAELGLLAHPPNPEQGDAAAELNFEAEEPLEQLEGRLRRAGLEIARPAAEEFFGAQLQLRTPDGLLVKVNRLDPGRYT